jgi:hypothetical protein
MVQERQPELGQMPVRVLFHLDRENQQGFKTESVWAVRIDSKALRVANSPFFVFGVSAEDVITARDIGGVLEFDRLLSKAGHSTYRVFLQQRRTIQSAPFREYWKPISALGATFEKANGRFISVDIPPGKNIHAIYELLEKGERDGIWAFEEGNYES